MPGIVRPWHMTPSGQLPQKDQQPDEDLIEDSSNSEADGRTTLADIMKNKAGGAGSSGTSSVVSAGCPKGPRTTPRKRKDAVDPK